MIAAAAIYVAAVTVLMARWKMARLRQAHAHELEVITDAAVVYTARQVDPYITADDVELIQLLWSDRVRTVELDAHDRNHDWWCAREA